MIPLPGTTGGVADGIALARCRLRRYRRIEARFLRRLAPNGVRLLRRCVFSEYLTLRDAGLVAEANLLTLPTEVPAWWSENW